MAVKQKVTRKELLNEPDKFMTFTGKVLEFIRKNERKLWTALVVLVSLVLVAAGARFYLTRRQNNAFMELSKARDQYSQALDSGKGVPEAVSAVEAVMKKYPRTDAANVAAGLLGHLYIREGQYDKAIEAFGKAGGKVKAEGVSRSLIDSGLAYAYEGKKDYSKALEYFTRLSADEKSPVREDAALALGRIYAELKQPDKSRKAYEDFLKKFPDSPRAQEAREAMSM